MSGATSSGEGRPSLAFAVAFPNILLLVSPDITRSKDTVFATSDGVTMFTRIPCLETSMASVRENMMTAAFIAPIIVSAGVATFPASDAMATIDPPGAIIGIVR